MNLTKAFQFCIHRAKKPPTRPALPAPTGQPTCPQKGHTADIAYNTEKANHKPKNRNRRPRIGCFLTTWASIVVRSNFMSSYVILPSGFGIVYLCAWLLRNCQNEQVLPFSILIKSHYIKLCSLCLAAIIAASLSKASKSSSPG